MDFWRRAAGSPRTLAVLAGAFNPPTEAHWALTKAALDRVEEVAFALPQTFPHKEYEGLPAAERLHLLTHLAEQHARCSVAHPRGGLFLEMAGEFHEAYGPDVDLWFLCGADAANRIVNWDYGRPQVVEEMLQRFGLLVAPRAGTRYEPPAHLRQRIQPLDLAGDWAHLSSTEVRGRVRAGQQWEHLVPPVLRDRIRQAYLLPGR